jgi:hypothetical protein
MFGMTLDEIGVSWQAAQVAVRRAQHKIAAALLERLGPAVVELARGDEPLRHDDPRALR